MADDTLYFLVNHQADAVDGWVGLATPGAAAVLMDPLTCRIGNAEFRTVDGRVYYKRFDASGWPLQPSGLLGPVHLVPLR